MRNELIAAAFAALALGTVAHAQSWSALPDWSGDWTVEPGKADPPAPYKAGWKIAAKAEDALNTCGVAAGAPRTMSMAGAQEWIVRPNEVWHAVEVGNTVQRIYTDGRQHPQGEDLFPTYTGDNVGHWEGDALVIDTVGLKDDTWLDDKGHRHGGQTHVVTRLHRVGDELLASIRVEDPDAFTKPWILERRYKRLPAGSFVHDWACHVVRTVADVN